MKIVLDTNIWISGLMLPHSNAGKVLTSWHANKFEIATSQYILDEIKKVLCYPKIQKRIHWNEQKIDQYISMLIFFTDFVSTAPVKTKAHIRDINDLEILKTFLASQSDYLVTSDKDLLELQPTYAVITLVDFCELIF